MEEDLVSRLKAARQLVGDVPSDTWRRIVSASDVTKKLTLRNKPVNRAMYKMAEMLRFVPDPESAFCLCEAPGGFVQAISTVHPKANVKCHSLSGGDAIRFHESIPDANIWMDEGGVNDICDVNVIQRMSDSNERVDLVTGDGGVEIRNLDEEEKQSFELLRHQILAAAHMLKPGGSCILKFFEGSLSETVNVLSSFATRFDSCMVVKPISSKLANSERYIIYRNYIPDASWIEKFQACDVWDHQPHAQSILSELRSCAESQVRHIQMLIDSQKNLGALHAQSRAQAYELCQLISPAFGAQVQRKNQGF